MLRIQSQRGLRLCNGLSRRDLLQIGAAGGLGLALPQWLHASESSSREASVQSVIVLFLSGGPSQLDMWDLKPEAPEEIRGTFQPIATSVPGIRISEHLPRTAAQMHHATLIRSMAHTDANHPSGAYWMMVGSPIARPTVQAATMSREDRPHLGSVLTKMLPRVPRVPSFVMVPEAISPVGPERPGQHAGFLGAAYDPYRVNSDPNREDFNPGALAPAEAVTAARLGDRRGLLRAVERHARYLEETAVGQVIDPYYARAFDLLSSPAAQEAFDLTRETTQTRDRYGRHVFGQSTLLARRLVEAGVRLVQVNWVRHDNGAGGQGYDSHRDHLAWSRDELLPPTDAALASLLEDLGARGLLDRTLVVVMGEFGRTPRFNANGGRDHWPHCFSVLLAGGGLPRGHVHGASDRTAARPATPPVSPQDLHATLYRQMGIDPGAHIHDLLHRPFPLVNGTPVQFATY